MGSPLALLRRWRRDPVAGDRVVALLLLLVGQFEVWLGGSGTDPTAVLAVATAVLAVSVAVRRAYPATVGVTAGLVGAAVAALWGPPSAVSFGVGWMCALYALSVWATPQRFAVGLVVIAVANLATTAGALPFAVAAPFTVITALVMLLVHRIITDRDGRALIAEREKDLAAREAVVEERARIARELHDVIAHHVSMIVIQAGAERRALSSAEPPAEPAETREVLRTIENVGRAALTEMRRFVNLLRGEPEESLTPQPGLEQLPALVAQLRASGVAVTVNVDGEPRTLPIGIDLSAYRIVQEALTNTLKHADHAVVTVGIRYGEQSVDLEIIDGRANHGTAGAEPLGRRAADGPGDGSAVDGGHGLVGMRERVLLYGGQFEAGRQPGGGFLVSARLPIS